MESKFVNAIRAGFNNEQPIIKVVVNKGLETEFTDPIPLFVMPDLHTEYLKNKIHFDTESGLLDNELHICIGQERSVSRDVIEQVYMIMRYSIEPQLDKLSVDDWLFVCEEYHRMAIPNSLELFLKKLSKEMPKSDPLVQLSFLTEWIKQHEQKFLWVEIETIIEWFVNNEMRFRSPEEAFQILSQLNHIDEHFALGEGSKSIIIHDMLHVMKNKLYGGKLFSPEQITKKISKQFKLCTKFEFDLFLQRCVELFDMSLLTRLFIEEILIFNECTKAIFHTKNDKKTVYMRLFNETLYCSTNEDDTKNIDPNLFFDTIHSALDYHQLNDWIYVEKCEHKGKKVGADFAVSQLLMNLLQTDLISYVFSRYCFNQAHALCVDLTSGRLSVGREMCNYYGKIQNNKFMSEPVCLFHTYPTNDNDEYDLSVRLPVQELLVVKNNILKLGCTMDKCFAIKRYMAYVYALPKNISPDSLFTNQQALNYFFLGVNPFDKIESLQDGS
jgi:hypothetical protein